MAEEPSIDSTPIRYLGDIRRVNIQPGDLFVLKCDSRITADQADKMRSIWKSRVCNGADEPRLVILERGMELEVIGIGESREIVVRTATDSEGGTHD